VPGTRRRAIEKRTNGRSAIQFKKINEEKIKYISEIVMGQKYFSGLNYTLGNEDTSVEIEMVKCLKPKSVFSICGSGGRSLPLMGEETELLTLADLSKEQLQLAELRLATYKTLTAEQFLLFWGYFPFSDNNYQNERKEIFLNLKLTPESREFFTNVFNEIHFDSLLYLGKWERTFAVFAKVCRVLLGSDFDRILRFDKLEDQIHYYRTEFPMKRWKALIHVLGNKAMFNALLYKGDFITKNSPLSHFDYYFQAFDRLFTRDLAQKSFFLHLCFYGKINSLKGVPVEAQAENIKRVNQAKTKIEYKKEDFVTYLSKGEKKYDFLSLSDVPSYFQGELEKDFMQKIKPGLLPGAIIVTRYYLRKSHCNLAGFVDITESYSKIIELEKVQMYEVRVYQYQP
jgi:S-adenosylmethionine-diacylglycerol 3-amino-3-carboxypropyl transferase